MVNIYITSTFIMFVGQTTTPEGTAVVAEALGCDVAFARCVDEHAKALMILHFNWMAPIRPFLVHMDQRAVPIITGSNEGSPDPPLCVCMYV